MLLRKFSRFLDLPNGDRWIVAKAALLTIGVWASLRLVRFSRVHALAQKSNPVERPVRLSDEPDRLSALVDLSGGVVPWCSTCLTRSLALIWLLRRRGRPSELRIGVEPVENGFASHAWVEIDGVPLNEAPQVCERFAVLDLTRADGVLGDVYP